MKNTNERTDRRTNR